MKGQSWQCSCISKGPFYFQWPEALDTVRDTGASFHHSGQGWLWADVPRPNGQHSGRQWVWVVVCTALGVGRSHELLRQWRSGSYDTCLFCLLQKQVGIYPISTPCINAPKTPTSTVCSSTVYTSYLNLTLVFSTSSSRASPKYWIPHQGLSLSYCDLGGACWL